MNRSLASIVLYPPQALHFVWSFPVKRTDAMILLGYSITAHGIVLEVPWALEEEEIIALIALSLAIGGTARESFLCQVTIETLDGLFQR